MKHNVACLLITVLVGTLLLAACGRGARRTQPSPLPTSQSSIAMQDVLAQIEGFQTPSGVDASVFQQLKDELARQLTARLQGKSVSTAPSGDGNRVMDLQASLDGDGNCALGWGYRNAGDYDLSGQVDVADITPIAMHFGKTSEGAGWEDARTADGDGNGVIGIADVSPLAMNYAIQVQSYAVYGADSIAGSWTFVQEAVLADAPKAEGARRFNIELGIPAHTLYRVVPRDASSAEGVPSAAAAVVAGGGEVTLDTATETIGPGGGSLELADGTRLIIPPGALAAGVELTLSKIVLGEGVLYGGPGFANYDLSGSALPSAFTFIHPAPQGLDPAQLAVAYYNPHDTTEYVENLFARNGDLLPISYVANTGIITATLGSGTSRAVKAISDGTARLTITQSSTFTINTTQVLVRTPYYAQAMDGACWAACATMLTKGQGTDTEIYNYLKEMGKADDPSTWGMTSAGVYGGLSNQMYQNSQYIHTSWSCFRYASLRNKLISELDNGNPSILFLPDHAITVVGYEKTSVAGQDIYTLIVHDPKNDVSEGGMYTRRPWSDIEAKYDASHIPFTIDSMTVLYSTSGISVSGDNLCTLGLPTGKNEGEIGFKTRNFPDNGNYSYIYLTWMPSSTNGYKWVDGAGVKEYDPIPNNVTDLNLTLPCWNAGAAAFNGTMEVIVSGAASPYTSAVSIPAEGSSSASFSIPVNDFRETNPDSQPTEAVEHTVTVRLVGPGGEIDSYCFAFKLQPGPHIDSINPAKGNIGDEITISGRNFGATSGQGRYAAQVFTHDYLELHDFGPLEVVSWTDTEIICKAGLGGEYAPQKVKVVTGSIGSNALYFNELYHMLADTYQVSAVLSLIGTEYYEPYSDPWTKSVAFSLNTIQDSLGYSWSTSPPPLSWVDNTFTLDFSTSGTHYPYDGPWHIQMSGAFTTNSNLSTRLDAVFTYNGEFETGWQRPSGVLSVSDLAVIPFWGTIVGELNGSAIEPFVADLQLLNEWGTPTQGNSWVTDWDWTGAHLRVVFTIP